MTTTCVPLMEVVASGVRRRSAPWVTKSLRPRTMVTTTMTTMRLKMLVPLAREVRRRRVAGATDNAPPAAKAGFAFGEETVKAAAEIDAVKDDGVGDNAGADAMSEQSPPDGEELVVPPSEQSERAEAKEAQSSSDSAPKIGIVQELPASKDGVQYVLENARVFTWSKPVILGNLTVEHYTTINKSSKGHVRAGVPKMHKHLGTIKLNERYRAFPENLLGNVKCLGILRLERAP